MRGMSETLGFLWPVACKDAGEAGRSQGGQCDLCQSGGVAQFVVTARREGTRAILRLEGDLDIASVPALSAAADEALAFKGCQQVVLDLHQLTFLDSSGMGGLVAVRAATEHARQTLVLDRVPDFAARVLTLGGLAAMFGLDADATIAGSSDPPVSDRDAKR